MRFADIPGYREQKEKLVKMFRQNRIGHAMIFVGESGSGSLALSVAFAQFINCLDPLENDSCGTCVSCVKISKFAHPDLHFYFPTTTSIEVKKNALSHKYYEKWRAFLNENLFPTYPSWLRTMDPNKKEAFISTDESSQIIKDLSLKSFESDSRFAIIWLPERMNVHSSNKLLKIIEEPPKNVYFFLVSENLELVLQTIVSRAQTLRVGLMDDAALMQWLKTHRPELSEHDLIEIVKSADGVPARAIQNADNKVDLEEVANQFITWARMCYRAFKQMPGLITYSEKLAGLPRDQQYRLLQYALDFFRNGMLLNSSTEDLVLSQGEDRKNIKNFSSLLNSKNTGKLMSIFNDAQHHISRHANTRIVFLDLSLSFARNINTKNVHL